MNRPNQVNVPQLIRRFGQQALLLTSAFATAVLIAIAFRPARVATVDFSSASQSFRPPVIGEAEREAAQAKLAEAMERFANAAQKAPEPAIAQEPDPAPDVVASRAAEPAPPTVADKTTAPAASAQPTFPPLSEADMRRLNGKAAQALRDGDVVGARLILERAIEGGDAGALLTLAETYDPKALARVNAKVVKPDLARARALYLEALEKGVTGARTKLDALNR